MRIEMETKLDFADVLIRPKRSTLTSRKDVDLTRTFKFPHGASPWTGTPIIAANMDGVGTLPMAESLSKNKILTALHKFHDIVEYNEVDREYTFITVGIGEKGIDFLQEYKKIYGTPRLLCIDVANGYTQSFIDFIKLARELCPDSILMAGNVVTGEMTEELIMSGADIVKIGIGPGTVCTTRIIAGVGYPQLSATLECADAAHGLHGLICTDGGCRSSGDISKAFGAGADFVMLGGMLAGHDESGQSVIEQDGKKYIEHHGSSSEVAMDIHAGGKSSYRASEGKQILIPYRGSVSDTMVEVLGGIRSTCTYVGAGRLKELSRRTTFVMVNRQLSPGVSDATSI
jgi:GMP reductase